MAFSTANGDGATVVPAQLEEKSGWDTLVATPFRNLQRLPPEFHRVEGERAFVAATSTTLHRISIDEPGVLEFLAEPTDPQGDRYHHELGFSTWPGLLSVRAALSSVFTRLKDSYDAGESAVDVGGLSRFMGELPYRVALVAEGQSIEPTAPQWLAFETIIEARGERNQGWFLALGEPATIGWHDGTGVDFRNVLCFGDDLPRPLHDLTPTYEVIFGDEDMITCGVHPALLRIGEPGPNIVDKMRAYRDLSDDMMSRLREFATHGSGWVGQW